MSGGPYNPEYVLVEGEVDGVVIHVLVLPGGEVRGAYPLRGPGVVRNPRDTRPREEKTEREVAEGDMIDALERQVAALTQAGVVMSAAETFLYVGEWLFAFEEVYIVDRMLPGILDPDSVNGLTAYFTALGEDLARFDGIKRSPA